MAFNLYGAMLLNQKDMNSFSPYGLQLRQTITSGTSVTFPTGVNWAYAIVVGGGGGGHSSTGGGGGGGGVTIGWIKVISSTSCIIGAGGSTGAKGGLSYIGGLVAGGGGNGGNAGVTAGAGSLGAGGGGAGSGSAAVGGYIS